MWWISDPVTGHQYILGGPKLKILWHKCLPSLVKLMKPKHGTAQVIGRLRTANTIMTNTHTIWRRLQVWGCVEYWQVVHRLKTHCCLRTNQLEQSPSWLWDIHCRSWAENGTRELPTSLAVTAKAQPVLPWWDVGLPLWSLSYLLQRLEDSSLSYIYTKRNWMMLCYIHTNTIQVNQTNCIRPVPAVGIAMCNSDNIFVSNDTDRGI